MVESSPSRGRRVRVVESGWFGDVFISHRTVTVEQNAAVEIVQHLLGKTGRRAGPLASVFMWLSPAKDNFAPNLYMRSCFALSE